MKQKNLFSPSFFLLATCSVLMFISSCYKGQPDQIGVYQSGGPHDDSKYARAADYFPMKFGSIWYYSVSSISGPDTIFKYALEGRIDSIPNRTNYYRMPDTIKAGWMGWGTVRDSEILAGSGILFHTRLMDSSSSYEEVMNKFDKHDQVQVGGLHTVSTSLGVFQCIRNDHRYYEADTFYQVRYFAKHIGYVKQEQYYLNNGVKSKQVVQSLDSTSF